MKRNSRQYFTGLLVGLASISFAQNNVFTLDADQPGIAVQPTMWGVFFEDINMGADGGLYAEMVKNRSFEFYEPLMGWKLLPNKPAEGRVLVVNSNAEKSNNPRYLSVALNQTKRGELGISNEGFRGMGVKQGLRYDFSVLFQRANPGTKLYLELVNPKGEVIGDGQVLLESKGKDWKKASASFTARATTPNAKLNVWFEGNGHLNLDLISLFPSDTWKQRPGGLRADMVQMLADMKPGFIRFPGGCVVEGHELSTRYQWKKTIGPVEERELMINRWNTEFAHRLTPDYYQSFGLGFFEYFQLAEDLGAEPLPILNCGMACQFNTSEVVPLDELAPYIEDALDLIEFANGGANTKWGKIRADMGHPAPFNLKMMGIGNENWGPQYIERLQKFTRAIKEKYPEIKLVNSAGPDPSGPRFDYLNSELRKMNADLIDEHYYRNPQWFLENVNRYDGYPRNQTKIFAGEYAAQSVGTAKPDNKNNLQTAIAEAAFLTGLERNADVVYMASYAPLFAHVQGWQWSPDLIWVDNLSVYGTPNYYVQKLYSLNKGTNLLPLRLNGKVAAGENGLYASSVIDTKTRQLIIKVVNASSKAVPSTFQINGRRKLKSEAILIRLSGDSPDAVNSIENPRVVSPKDQTVRVKKQRVDTTLEPNSFNVIKINYL